MSLRGFQAQVRSKFHRTCAEHLYRRPLAIHTPRPIISFTFDDFPASALAVGGRILRNFGATGTYYVSLGLAGQIEDTGTMYTLDTLASLHRDGHELGCHTWGHLDSMSTPTSQFLASVDENQRALSGILNGLQFRSFSFPKSAPRAFTKQGVGRKFECCRGGGQTFNTGAADRNYLRAFFIEQAGGDFASIRNVVDRNADAQGWLIFATHDIAPDHTRFGCTPELFEQTVRYAVSSGATILPVAAALDALRSLSSQA